MTREECFREPDVVEAVRSGEWPHRCEAGLRAHVESCPVCAEVLAVALAFQHDADDAEGHVRLPTAAHVWWRAGIRARQDAVAKAARPITVMEGFAAASGAGIAAAGIALGWSAVSTELHQFGTLAVMAVAVAGGAAIAIALPVVLYFVLSEPKG